MLHLPVGRRTGKARKPPTTEWALRRCLHDLLPRQAEIQAGKSERKVTRLPKPHCVSAKAPCSTHQNSFSALLLALQGHPRWQALGGQKAHSPGSGASARAQPQQPQPQMRQMRERAAWQFPPRQKQCRPAKRWWTWQRQPQRWRKKQKLVSGGVCLAFFTALAASLTALLCCAHV